MRRENEADPTAGGAGDLAADDFSVDAALAWLSGGCDVLVARLVDEMPDLRDHVLYPLRFALTSAIEESVDARWGFGYAAGVAAQMGLTWTAASLQRLARCEGWVTPGPPWSPLDVNVVVTVADAVDRAVDELARAGFDPALDAAQVWVAGGLDALTLRLARAIPDHHEDEMVPPLRRDLATAADGMGGAARDLLRGDIVWTLGKAAATAHALGLHYTESATLKLSIAYRNEPAPGDEPTVTTVEAVDKALDELHERFVDHDG